jgi:hypothetical protein
MNAAIDPALAVAVAVNVLKPLLERRWAPADPLHDSAIRALAFLAALLGYLACTALTAPRLGRPLLWADAQQAAITAGKAILFYHLVTGVAAIALPGTAAGGTVQAAPQASAVA